jgi:hypothetical protein
MSGGNRLPYLLVGLIADHIRGIKQRFARLAAAIGAGTYAPRRRRAPPRAPTLRRPPRPGRLPRTFG